VYKIKGDEPMKKITFVRCTCCNDMFPMSLFDYKELSGNPLCPACYREIKWNIYQEDEDYD
jgi:formylmethanofuran dehydrogenase subunit E